MDRRQWYADEPDGRRPVSWYWWVVTGAALLVFTSPLTLVWAVDAGVIDLCPPRASTDEVEASLTALGVPFVSAPAPVTGVPAGVSAGPVETEEGRCQTFARRRLVVPADRVDAVGHFYAGRVKGLDGTLRIPAWTRELSGEVPLADGRPLTFTAYYAGRQRDGVATLVISLESEWYDPF